MPITFACECGKQMVAKDEFAGRRMKCPACQRVVAIPGGAAPARPVMPTPVVVAEEPVTIAAEEPVFGAAAEETVYVAAAEPAPPLPVPLAGSTPIRFSCSCGKVLQADPSKIGRPLRCPSCGTLVTVPAESLPPPAPRRSAARPKRWPEGALEQRITPWRSGDAERFGARDWERRDRRSNRGLSGLLALLVLLSAGALVLYYQDDIREGLQGLSPGMQPRAAVTRDHHQADSVLPPAGPGPHIRPKLTRQAGPGRP